MISTAIGIDRVSRAVGYKLKPENFSPDTPYLPQRIAILGEANTANQASVVENTPFEFISAKEVGDKYGYGSVLYQIARILRPVSGNLLGGIPTVIYPQLETGTATVITNSVTVATTVTENATHKVVISGRDGIDGVSYSYNVVKGENTAAVVAKVIDAINNVLGAPVAAVDAAGDVESTTKWLGKTGAEVNISFEVGDKPAGIVYAEVSKVDGTGSPSIANALTAIGNNWDTLLINPYGADQFDALEAFNGVPDPVSPTGRYSPTDFKPLVALFGSLLSDKDDVVAITNASARQDQVTNVLCPAPNSTAHTWEAAANVALVTAPIYQNTPHLDNSAAQYFDMPVPANENIGDFSDYDARDFMVKKGASTVNIVAGKYTIQDFVTTYAPTGEAIPKFRFVRDLNVDWNIAFGWILVMQRDIQDKAIVPDDSPSTVDSIISPKQVKQLVSSFVTEKAEQALIADPAFSEESTQVGINGSNPARLDTSFRYKRTSTAHIVSTDAAVDFNFTV